MQIVFQYLPQTDVILLQLLSKRYYKRVEMYMKVVKVADYDTSVFARLKQDARLLLMGGRAKKFTMSSLATNYTPKDFDCNFAGGQTLFSLFQT